MPRLRDDAERLQRVADLRGDRLGARATATSASRSTSRRSPRCSRPRPTCAGLQELQRRALLTLKGHFQLDNLLAFNRKFFPRWERRFVVYERRRDLPRVGIAALAAEAYLPFQGERR